jgi:hypothetical protein
MLILKVELFLTAPFLIGQIRQFSGIFIDEMT